MGKLDLWKTKVGKAGDTFFNDAHEGDIIVPVMGPTGVGKSSFINSYLGRDNLAQVGHDLKSCTTALLPFIINLPPGESGNPRRLVLVDTPGFDDTHEADSEILRRIAVWLASSYGPGKTCGGLIYLHDITDARMRGTTLQNLKVFQRLCGKKNLGAVVFGTTKSGKLTRESFARREKQLSDVYWKDFKKQGAIVFELLPSHESAGQLVKAVLDRLQGEQRVLLIQKELVDLAKSLPATQAGQELKYTLEEIMEHKERALASDNVINLTEEQIAEHKRMIAMIAPQIKEMKLSFTQRLLQFSEVSACQTMVDSIVELNRSRSEVLQIQRKLPDKPLPDDIREFADSASEFPSVAPPLSSASSSASQSNFVSTESIDEVQRQTGMFSGARNIRMREAQMNSVGGNMTINNIVYYAAGSQVQISLSGVDETTTGFPPNGFWTLNPRT